MKEEGDVFKKFRDSFSRMEGHFHILEQRVPVELQMEYFKYSENVRKENRPPRPLSEDECETLYNTLLTEETKDKTEKRYLLSQIGYLEIRPCVPLVGGIHPASGPRSDRLGLHGFDGVSYLLRVRFLRRETKFISRPAWEEKGRSCVSMS